MSDPIYEAQAFEIAKMARSISALEAENAKLRELLVDSLLMPSAYAEKYGIRPNFIVCSNHWGDRMRAMGIEV